MPRSDSPLAGVAAAIDEGRVIGSEAALALCEQALAARRVAAHSNAQVADRVRQAVSDALSGPGADETDDEPGLAQLFPPSAPLGPPLGHDDTSRPPLVYHGDDQGKPNRRPCPAASAWEPYSDAELHAALFGTSYYGPAGGPG